MKHLVIFSLLLFFHNTTQAQATLIDTFGFEWLIEPSDADVHNSPRLIESNDPNQSTFNIDLVEVREMPLFNQIGTSTDELTYSNTVIGTEETQSLSIFNNGDGPLEITEFEISNDSYSILNPMFSFFPYVISPGDSIEILVLFVPTEQATYGGILTLHSNDPDNPEYEISLIGNGVFTTGFSTASANVLIKAYPNPTKDMLSIELEGKAGPYQILLVNNEGKQLKVLDSNSVNQPIESFAFDLSDLPNGLYHLMLVNEKEIFRSLPIVKN